MSNCRTPHTVTSDIHATQRLAPDTCRACQGSGKIVKPGDCPRCEGTGRDFFYGTDRPVYMRGKRKQ